MTLVQINNNFPDKSVLTYVNKFVIDRYCLDNNKTTEFGLEVFNQFTRFMYICGVAKKRFLPTQMMSDILEIDHMWHSFILFTKEYEIFCHKYFGEFIHHAPFTEDNPKPSGDDLTIILKNMLVIIYQELGKEVLVDWFERKLYAAS